MRMLAKIILLLMVVESVAAENLPLPAERFEVNGNQAFVMTAQNSGGEKPWVWYAPTLGNLPNRQHAWYFKQLIERGVSVAGINLGEVRGSPASAEKFTAFYDEMVRRGFSPKPILLGQSRGGLMMLTWAMRHPDKLTAFAGIYPVCNLASWPMKNSKDKVLKDYGLPEAELTANLSRYNPIDNLQGLLANKVPFFIVHGNADTLVPYDENGKLLKERCEAGGGQIAVKIIDGEGHKVTPGFFECQELLDFVLKQAEGKK
ncbi:MAG: prolyl oligopeptidase family serine peptidase [Kiritimatiellales bacterium]